MRQSRSEELRNQLGLPALSHNTKTRLNKLMSRIRHSAQKRMVIVEGKTDKRIYWWVRDRFGTGNARVFDARGIDELLKIYDQKSTLFNDRGVAVAFMADRDLERLFCTNPRPGDIVWTEGYCIENDLYEGYVKDHLENLLETSEANKLRKMRDAVVEWFAFEVEEFRAGREHKTGKDLDEDELVLPGHTRMNATFLEDRGFVTPDRGVVDELKKVYNLRVAGKLLFQMLARFLDDSDRVRKYPGSQTYKLAQMYELAGKNTSNSKTQRLIIEIEQKLGEGEEAIAAKKLGSGERKTAKRKSAPSDNSYATNPIQSGATDERKPKSTRRRRRRRKRGSTSSGHTSP